MVKKCQKIMVLPLIVLMISLLSFFVSGIGLGNSGHEVRRIQERLDELGYFDGKTDGIFSPELSGAVRSFQSANRLTESGEADSHTLDALFDKQPPENSSQKLLAKYIYEKSAGSPYWEQLSCGLQLLEKLKNAESPNTLASLIIRELGAELLLRIEPDSTAKQAAIDCLNASLHDVACNVPAHVFS